MHKTKSESDSSQPCGILKNSLSNILTSDDVTAPNNMGLPTAYNNCCERNHQQCNLHVLSLPTEFSVYTEKISLRVNVTEI